MNQGSFTKNYKAGAAIGKRLIVKFGTDDRTVIQAAAAADDIIGVSTDIDAASGERCDVAHEGIMPVIAGGTIARGKPVTSDANGKAVQAAPGAGANVRLLGIALQDAVSGDIFDVLIQPSVMQG